MFGAAQRAVAAMMLEIPERLPKDCCRFLRIYLECTQKELAERMGVTRKTVNEWETKGRISPQNDLILRAMVFGKLTEALRPSGAIDHVRTAAPRAKLLPLVVKRIDEAA